MFNDLVKDPFHLTMPEIGALTPYQVREVYFRDERKDDPPAPPSEKELFWRINKEHRGYEEEVVQRLWDAHIAAKNKQKPNP